LKENRKEEGKKMDIFILSAIAIANIIAIALLWYCMRGISQKEKFLFIAIGIGIMYVLVSGIFVVSGNKIDNAEITQTAKNFITFTFVPVNAILIEAYIARSYRQYREETIKSYQLKRRCFVFGILLCILLALEYVYFGDIQEGIQSMIQAKS